MVTYAVLIVGWPCAARRESPLTRHVTQMPNLLSTTRNVCTITLFFWDIFRPQNFKYFGPQFVCAHLFVKEPVRASLIPELWLLGVDFPESSLYYFSLFSFFHVSSLHLVALSTSLHCFCKSYTDFYCNHHWLAYNVLAQHMSDCLV